MKLNDLEDMVGRVALDYFEYKNPGYNAIDNPRAVQTCIEETAFIINKFISYFNMMAEGELND